jgi:hypothetical protein
MSQNPSANAPHTRLKWPGRTRLAIALLIVAALGNVRLLRSANDYYRAATQREDLAEYTQRFAALRAELPPHEIVGYVDDGRPFPDQVQAFNLTRYVMAPVRVLATPSRPLVIANLSSAAAEPCGAEAANLMLVRDFGHGVRLYRHRLQP